MRQINPDVVAGYPITPQTLSIEKFSEYVADGLVDTEFILTESEHSAMSACIGAAACGGRVITATASAGLAFMWEVLYVAASTRLPITMCVMNRALSGPINIHCDHSDSMGARDSSWIQIFGENAQEAYDNAVQAVRIAEHRDVRLPVMTMQDGFIISHSVERVEVLEDEKVKKFIGEIEPLFPLLDTENPLTYGPLDLYDYYFEHKRQQAYAMEKSFYVIEEVGREFEKISKRGYGLLEGYELEDAEYALVCLGSTAGTTKVAVDELREKGLKVGLLKVRVFRPFPYEHLRESLKHLEGIAVLDRSESFGAYPPLFSEVRSALYEDKVKTFSLVYGLGGRDITKQDIKKVFEDLISERLSLRGYLGVRE
ncbi:MAG: pyruvate ferredoxin oxidoreductase [Candidatus Methanofastidiosia archaeon]